MKKLNKKNMKKFANSLFYEKNGYEYYVKMCKGELNNGKGMCCALGEMAGFFKIEYNIHTNENEDEIVYSLLDLMPLQYNYDYSNVDEVNESHDKVAEQLSTIYSINDSCNNYYKRAKYIKNHIVKNIIPLLPN